MATAAASNVTHVDTVRKTLRVVVNNIEQKTTQIYMFMELQDLLRKYDLKDVAEESGVSLSTLYFWLNGTTLTPRIDTLAKVAKVLGYTIALVPSGRKKLPKGFI